jgi:hypothetical protein
MGMDVYGKNPTCEVGKYFRRNVWGWRPLADICLDLAPAECEPCEYWHSNDGDGLGRKQSVALAVRLDAVISNGEAEAYIKERDDRLAAMKDVACSICAGSGVRTDAVGVSNGWPLTIVAELDSDQRPNPRAGQVGSCNACGGRGSRRPYDSYYGLDLDDVKEFSAFVRASGGFEIC